MIWFQLNYFSPSRVNRLNCPLSRWPLVLTLREKYKKMQLVELLAARQRRYALESADSAIDLLSLQSWDFRPGSWTCSRSLSMDSWAIFLLLGELFFCFRLSCCLARACDPRDDVKAINWTAYRTGHEVLAELRFAVTENVSRECRHDRRNTNDRFFLDR